MPLVLASKERVEASETARPQAMLAESVLAGEGLELLLPRAPARDYVEREAKPVLKAFAAEALQILDRLQALLIDHVLAELDHRELLEGRRVSSQDWAAKLSLVIMYRRLIST